MSSFCLGCGTSLSDGERFCGNCGRDSSASATAATVPDPAASLGLLPEPSGKAIFSLVSGVLSFFPPFAFVAIIFGHLSLSDIRRSSGRLTGRGFAITGLVLGYLAVTATVVLVIIGVSALPLARKAANTNRLTPRVTTNQPSAVSALRTLNTAEIAYAQAHPVAGYTCSLTDLAGSWGISSDLAAVKKNGYVLQLQGCASDKTNGPVTKYRAVAYPAKTNNTRLPAFCSNQSDVIKMDWNGSPEDCLSKGSDLTETQINHPQGWTSAAPR